MYYVYITNPQFQASSCFKRCFCWMSAGGEYWMGYCTWFCVHLRDCMWSSRQGEVVRRLIWCQWKRSFRKTLPHQLHRELHQRLQTFTQQTCLQRNRPLKPLLIGPSVGNQWTALTGTHGPKDMSQTASWENSSTAKKNYLKLKFLKKLVDFFKHSVFHVCLLWDLKPIILFMIVQLRVMKLFELWKLNKLKCWFEYLHLLWPKGF